MADMFEKAKSRVLDRIESPRDLLEFKLGAALKMERTLLEMLDRLQNAARTGELKGQLRHHADETRGIAVYETLITLAESRGDHDVVGRLRQNLEQEQHTLAEVNDALRERAYAQSHVG